jgi:hypothetical protein
MNSEVHVMVCSNDSPICQMDGVRFRSMEILFITKELDVLERDKVVASSTIDERVRLLF